MDNDGSKGIFNAKNKYIIITLFYAPNEEQASSITSHREAKIFIFRRFALRVPSLRTSRREKDRVLVNKTTVKSICYFLIRYAL